MYKCFESIPLDIRQQAFDAYVLAICASVQPPPYHRSYFQHWYCCPLGAVNIVAISRQTESRKILEDILDKGYAVSMPTYGYMEQVILYMVGLTTDKDSVDDFIARNDREGFASFADLADAMGVEYDPTNKNHLTC